MLNKKDSDNSISIEDLKEQLRDIKEDLKNIEEEIAELEFDIATIKNLDLSNLTKEDVQNIFKIIKKYGLSAHLINPFDVAIFEKLNKNVNPFATFANECYSLAFAYEYKEPDKKIIKYALQLLTKTLLYYHEHYKGKTFRIYYDSGRTIYVRIPIESLLFLLGFDYNKICDDEVLLKEILEEDTNSLPYEILRSIILNQKRIAMNHTKFNSKSINFYRIIVLCRNFINLPPFTNMFYAEEMKKEGIYYKGLMGKCDGKDLYCSAHLYEMEKDIYTIDKLFYVRELNPLRENVNIHYPSIMKVYTTFDEEFVFPRNYRKEEQRKISKELKKAKNINKH